MSYLKQSQEFHDLMMSGKSMEAFEKYYHENVQVKEMPTGEVRDGKEAQRKAIEGWFGNVKEHHGGGLKSLTSDEKNGITSAETWFDITFKDGNRVKMEEVAVQKWKDNQIIEEKFYYNMPGQ